MEHLATDLLPVVRAAVVATCVLLALIALQRASRTGASGRWVAAAFATAAAVLLMGFVPAQTGVDAPLWWDLTAFLLAVSYPYLLLRFAASFRAFPRWVEWTARTGVAGIAVMTAALVVLPEDLRTASPVEHLYLVVFLGYWILLSMATVVRLWRAGGGQPTVARRRMRLMSSATMLLALVLLAPQFVPTSTLTELLTQTTLLVSSVTFGVGFAPPRVLRRAWREHEEQEVQHGTVEVLRATTLEDVATALLPPTVRIVAADGAALVDPEGRVMAGHGRAPEVGTVLDGRGADVEYSQPREVVPLGQDHGDLVLWTTPYTPFFGQEEIDLLRAMGAVATLALDRVGLLEAERSQHAVLERAHHEAELARKEAVDADQAKTEFLSRMSHELRTPLNAILGFGQLLEVASLDDDDDRESVDHILKAGHHLLALINDVLDLSRIEAGRLTISLEPVHVGQLIEDTIPLMRPMADARSIRITTPDADACDRYVLTDRQRCRQVLLNLLSNAVKYNRNDGEVEIHCRQMDDAVLRVSVRDTGAGISPDRQQQLFQPFERLGAEGTGVEGTGLGLALTKQLVERLSGTIGVESAPGQGSTFWIELPVTDPYSVPEGTVEHVPAVGSTADHTLLLVEDNLANLHLVEAFLRHRPGISVLPAMQGRLALELAHEHRPDVVVLDLHLPDVSGGEILSQLRADPLTRDIPVVIASADASPGRIRQLRGDGAFDYVTKPLDLHAFLEVVDRALAHRSRPSASASPDLG